MPIDSLMEYEPTWVDALNRGDVSAADEAFMPDCILHFTDLREPLCGVGADREFVAGFIRASPDLHFIIEQQLVEGDLMAFRFRATGTQIRPLGQAPATGKRIAIDGLIIDRVVGGKVQERWEQFDQPLMLQQLGPA
jgi:predicted ester cyclase